MREIEFDSGNFLETFEKDLSKAVSSLLIESPFLTLAGVERLKPSLESIISRGVRVCVYVQEQPQYIQSDADAYKHEQTQLSIRVLEKVQAHVNIRPGIHKKIAVIDACIEWNGSLNIMSFNPKRTSERMTRTVNPYKALATIAKHSLDICSRCMDVRNCDPIVISDATSLGALIASRRKALGLSQSALAAKIGSTRKTINSIESGKGSPSFGSLIEIASALDECVVLVPSYTVPFIEQMIRVLPKPGVDQRLLR